MVFFFLLLDSFYPALFTDHSERENMSSAAFFELFSSEIIFVCLISCQGIILWYSAWWNSSKGKGYVGPNGVLSLLFSVFLVIVIASFSVNSPKD